MTRPVDLVPLLIKVRLGPIADTLPERIALARREQLDYASFLEIILSDEVNRRDNRRLQLRMRAAGFEDTCALEDFDWSASVTLTEGSSTMPSPWNSWTSTSVCSWWAPPVWARPSCPRPSATRPSVPATASAFSMPTNSFGV